MEQREKNEKSILDAVELVRTRMSQIGMDYDNHNDFLNFMRLVRSGDVVMHVRQSAFKTS